MQVHCALLTCQMDVLPVHLEACTIRVAAYIQGCPSEWF